MAQNDELECFRGIKKKEPSMSSNNQQAHERVTPPDLAPPSTPVSDKTEQNAENKPSALECVLTDLLAAYHFINHNRQLYVYLEDQGYWKLIPASNSNYELRSLIPSNTKRMAMKVNFTALYDWLLVEAEPVEGDFFRDNYHHINFRNGTLNWKKGKFKVGAERKKYNFRYALQVDYCEEEKSSGVFKEFLKTVFGEDKETRKAFYQFLALCLGDIRSLKYCGFLLGPSNSGKTTVLSVLKHVLGAENCSSLSFSQISNNEFALTQLQGKRINVSGEVSGTSNKKMDIWKSITGNDPLTASFKCRDHFQFDSHLCMLVFACNCLPAFDNNYLEMESFLSRILIYPFSNQIPRNKWQKDFLSQLTSDVAGIVECVLEGFKLLEANNFQIFETAAMRACKLDYAGTWESFSSFCDKFIEKAADKKLTSSEIQKCYRIYCNQYDLIELYSNQWVQILKNKYPCSMSTQVIKSDTDKTTRVRAYKGITFTKGIKDLLEKEQVEGNCANIPETKKW